MMSGPLSFFIGTLTYRTDAEKERVANAFLTSGACFLSIKNGSPGCEFTVYATQRRKTGALLDKSGIKVYSIEGKGLLRLLYDRRKRYGLLLGALIFAFALFFADRVVWDVRVTGCGTFSEDEIVQRLKACGLYYGTGIPDFDHEGVGTVFLHENPEFSWIGINFDGCVANVVLRETLTGKSEKKTLYSNLIAREPGQIVRTVVSKGQLAVSPLDVVKAGDLLVSGFVEKKLGFETVRSAGEVYAEVERTFEVEVPYEYKLTIPTGEKHTGYAFELFGLSFSLPFFREPGENGKVTSETERVVLFDSVRLPVFINKVTSVPTEEKTFLRGVEEARKEAYRLMKEKTAPALAGCEVSEITYEEKENGDSFALKLVFRGIDDIAEERIIEVS